MSTIQAYIRWCTSVMYLRLKAFPPDSIMIYYTWRGALNITDLRVRMNSAAELLNYRPSSINHVRAASIYSFSGGRKLPACTRNNLHRVYVSTKGGNIHEILKQTVCFCVIFTVLVSITFKKFH